MEVLPILKEKVAFLSGEQARGYIGGYPGLVAMWGLVFLPLGYCRGELGKDVKEQLIRETRHNAPIAMPYVGLRCFPAVWS